MKNNNDRIAKAMRLAELALEDKRDVNQCIDEMQTFAGLSPEEAKIVTSSLRAGLYPQELRAEGFSDEEIQHLITANADFATDPTQTPQPFQKPVKSGVPGVVEYKDETDDTDEDSEPAMLGGEDEDEDAVDDTETNEFPTTDPSEDTDDEFDTTGNDDTAELTVEVPKEKLLALQQAIADVFAEQGMDDFGDTESPSPFDGDDTSEFANESGSDEHLHSGDDDELGDDYDIEIMDDEPVHGKPASRGFPKEPDFGSEDEVDDVRDFDDDKHVLSKLEVDKMTKEVLAKRKAAREALLAQAKTKSVRTASDGEQETKGVGLAADPASNTFDKSKAAQLHTDEFDFERDSLDNSQGSELVNEAKWKPAKQEIPTLNKGRLELNKAYTPSTMEGSPEDRSDYVIDFDVYDIPSQMTDAERGKLPKIPQTEGGAFDSHRGQVLATAKDGKKEKKGDKEAENLKIEVEAKAKKALDEAFISERARMKTAYSCAYRLVAANHINVDEADGFVDMWLDNNATAKQIKVQTGVMLRSSGAINNNRMASSDAPSTRTASKSTVPTFVGYGSLSNPAVEDLKQALSGVWSTPSKDEFEQWTNRNLEDK